MPIWSPSVIFLADQFLTRIFTMQNFYSSLMLPDCFKRSCILQLAISSCSPCHFLMHMRLEQNSDVGFDINRAGLTPALHEELADMNTCLRCRKYSLRDTPFGAFNYVPFRVRKPFTMKYLNRKTIGKGGEGR